MHYSNHKWEKLKIKKIVLNLVWNVPMYPNLMSSLQLLNMYASRPAGVIKTSRFIQDMHPNIKIPEETLENVLSLQKDVIKTMHIISFWSLPGEEMKKEQHRW